MVRETYNRKKYNQFFYLNQLGDLILVLQREHLIFVHLGGSRLILCLYPLSIHTANPQIETIAEYATNQPTVLSNVKSLNGGKGTNEYANIFPVKINRITFIVSLTANGGNTSSLLRAGILLLSSVPFCIIPLSIVLELETFNKCT